MCLLRLTIRKLKNIHYMRETEFTRKRAMIMFMLVMVLEVVVLHTSSIIFSDLFPRSLWMGASTSK